MSPARAPGVLVVDADPAALEAFGTTLRHQGYEVALAPTIEVAVAALRGVPPECVLLDLALERAAAQPLLAELRGYPPQTVATILTGKADAISLVDVHRAGAYDYLIKPADTDVLKLTVARAIERTTLARTMREALEDVDAANAQLRILASDLQRRVDEATRELRQKLADLDQAKRELEHANSQRDDLIALVAHELGAPLTAVQGYAELLGDAKIAPAVQERARRVVLSETRRVARLVDDLVAAARLAGGTFQLRPIACDLGEVARQQVELARAQAPAQTIRLDAGQVLIAECDRERTAQVLGNLLRNALKYAAGGEITVRVWSTDDAARLAVSDQGPGIPPHRLEDIFEPHVRLRRGSATGAGLGLHIARAIVEAHGGRIWAESLAGQGATFHVSLPLVARPRPAKLQTARAAVAKPRSGRQPAAHARTTR